MTANDEFKILVGGYFGVREIEAYILKEYVLQDIENYIKQFIQEHLVTLENLREEAEKLNELSLKRKLQDSLLTLHKINGPFELEHMIKLRLEELRKGE